MVQAIHRYSPEIYELQSYVDFPHLDIVVSRTRVLPNGDLEICYELTSALKATLEVQRKLRNG